jgi:hypothetical protein
VASRFAVEPRRGLGFCVPLHVELMDWSFGPPGVSWREYQAISGEHGWRALWCWLRGAYDHREYALDADALRLAREGKCYSRRGIQVHFCQHKLALGLRPRGEPGPIPDEWQERLVARGQHG